ncbi:MAG: hypothetical protein K2M44_03830 [Clostridia bacterium]|nr:hypothetical protein [Clostridia bacterium]
MIERALVNRNCGVAIKITVKGIISIVLIALAVGLPLMLHAALGQQGGAMWLPIYLPVLLCGCILGVKWGVAVGITAPVISYLITLAIGEPMPALTRLPYMIAELAAAAAVTGAVANKITEKGIVAVPAVILGLLAGRLTFLVLAAIFASISPLSVAAAWSQIRTGLAGAGVQAVVVPIIVIALRKALLKDDKR